MENKRPLIRPLKSHARFEILKKKGKKLNISPWLLVNYGESEGLTAYGWTVPRYVGGAVVRNRIRRWMREFFLKNQEIFAPLGLELNLVLRRQKDEFYRQLEHREVDENLRKMAQKLAR